ncbi:IclR family transcriptional regulator [Arsenicitalea aurantiaca]|uniref:IclR family transcriptional regulator n=1 Tax=Arsenicitalea aurantiaca TaxID=1783274 RepID=A0A433X3K1_9HYPH|nr:IclR family transcriptional regulator [Arsenicitalea aurantiaca]
MAEDAASKHRIPVIDRMMEVLTQLERRANGVTISELVAQLDMPRTTIYRILNTLQLHDMVRRDDGGAYHLGRRLLRLASHVAAGASPFDLASIAQPFLEQIAAQLGEGTKLSVIDHEGILVLAAAQGRREYALTVAPGQRMPIHAGAASKLLIAHLPEEEQANWLERPLMAFTSKSITDPKRLANELTRIKRLGWAQDKGENAPSIHAFAAPVFDKSGTMIAALSVPFLAGAEPSRMEEIRLAVIEAARALSDAIPG